ncbi:hypothetical protein KJ966_12035 [bacterium]|nr:hypothetical protein [bacterium]
MNIADILNRIIDWFVPQAFFEDQDKLLRSRMIVMISVIVAVVWIPFVFRYGPLSITLGFVLAAFVLLMPFFQRWTSSLFLAGHGLVLVIALTSYYRAYWNGGFESSVLWWYVISPVVAVLLLGNRSAFFWLVVNAVGIFSFSYFESNRIEIPGSDRLGNDEIMFNIISLVVILTIVCLYLERSKNSAMKIRLEEANRSKRLADDMQNIGLEIKRNSKTVYSTSNELTNSMQRMKSGAQEIARIEEEGATAINQSTQTIQELAASLDETVKKMKELEKLAVSIETTGTEGSVTLNQSAKAIAKINEGRQEYNIILQAITDIADSAHLLSLNAAIEAAKAGEFGKGFFVVVEEIRDLAKRSNDAVVDIRRVMKQGGYVIIRGKSVISSLSEIFDIVGQLVSSLTRQIKAITIAIEEQNIGIREIAQGTDEIAHSSEENITLIQNLNRSIEDNANTIENLHQIAEQLEKRIVRIDSDN